MSVGQIGLVKCDFEEHKQILAFKDEDNQIQTVENSPIYYFVYLDEEIKTGANIPLNQPNGSI